MSSSSSAAASVTEQARRQANLRLLQRTCSPQITDILVSATHVVLYEYRDNAWFKSGIEGSLFVVQKNDAAAAGDTLATELIVLNRHSTNNFQMVVTSNFQLQLADPYLIFQQKATTGNNGDAKEATTTTTRIRGIWFHSADERINVFTVLQQTLHIMQQHEQAAAAIAATATATPAGKDEDANSSSSSNAAVLATLFSPLTIVDNTSTTAAAPPPLSATLPRAASTPSSGSIRQTPAAAGNTSSSTISGQVNNAPPSPAVSAPAGVALDKKSLQLALLSLIQDDRFLDLLHSQYLRVVHARAKKQDKK